jgi:hypothetical protein
MHEFVGGNGGQEEVRIGNARKADDVRDLRVAQ